MGNEKIVENKAKKRRHMSIRQVSSTQLSAICATDFPGYLACKV